MSQKYYVQLNKRSLKRWVWISSRNEESFDWIKSS